MMETIQEEKKINDHVGTSKCLFHPDVECNVQDVIRMGMKINTRRFDDNHGWFTQIPEIYSVLPNYCLICGKKVSKELEILGESLEDSQTRVDVLEMMIERNHLQYRVMLLDNRIKQHFEEEEE